jgi:hypothetical protein
MLLSGSFSSLSQELFHVLYSFWVFPLSPILLDGWWVFHEWVDCLGAEVFSSFFVCVGIETCHQVILAIFCRQRSVAWRRVILLYSALGGRMPTFIKRPMKSEYVINFFLHESATLVLQKEETKCISISSYEFYFHL